MKNHIARVRVDGGWMRKVKPNRSGERKTMATDDVPGANPKNADVLASGCWAEHQDGSLIFVKGTENDQVVYEIYDVAQEPPVYYQDAMRGDAFKKQFSWTPIGTSTEKWTWHDKTPFPWHKVMKTFDKPKPTHADVHDELTAAARVAKSLRLRAQNLSPGDVEHMTEQTVPAGGRTIRDRIQKAIDALFGG